MNAPVDKIAFEDLAIRAGDFERRGISLRVPAGECAVLMGKTGCGKTTLMETLCGLRPAAGGRILISGRDVTEVPPRARGIGYVPQDVALFSSMSVFENMAFPLRIRSWGETEIRERVEALAERLEVAALLGRRVTGLSGGEAKRVALGRALAFRPEILCLDEPLSALDVTTHESMCALIRETLNREGVTAFLITHNPQEAKLLGDRIFQW